MSIAKVVSVTSCRKDQGPCGKCRVEIKRGDGYVHWTVGFRGMTRRRCSKPECFPKISERESSMVADIYAAQEDAEGSIAAAPGYDELIEARDAVVEVAEAVADEYESNEMFDRNEDLQERAEMIRSYADELSGWEPEREQPVLDVEETWTDKADEFNEALEQWLDAAREDLLSAIREGELP